MNWFTNHFDKNIGKRFFSDKSSQASYDSSYNSMRGAGLDGNQADAVSVAENSCEDMFFIATMGFYLLYCSFRTVEVWEGVVGLMWWTLPWLGSFYVAYLLGCPLDIYLLTPGLLGG